MQGRPRCLPEDRLYQPFVQSENVVPPQPASTPISGSSRDGQNGGSQTGNRAAKLKIRPVEWQFTPEETRQMVAMSQESEVGKSTY